MTRPSASLSLLFASVVALAPLSLTACDSDGDGTDGETISPLVGSWKVTYKEGLTLPDIQEIDDPYGGGLDRRETRGEMMIFADSTGYIDIIEEDYYTGQPDPNVDYQVWDLRVIARKDPKKIDLRIIRRDDLRVLDCKIGNNEDRLTCTDPEADPGPEPEMVNFAAWEFVKTE